MANHSTRIWRTVVFAGAMLATPLAGCGGSSHKATAPVAAEPKPDPAIAAQAAAADEQARRDAELQAQRDAEAQAQRDAEAQAEANRLAEAEAARKAEEQRKEQERMDAVQRVRGGGFDRPRGRGFVLS